MFVTKLYTDNWTGNRNEENCIENPSWQQIKTAICELDGSAKTLVSLEADDESYMMIGGGNAGKYVVTTTLNNEVFYSLLRQVDEISKSDVYRIKSNLFSNRMNFRSEKKYRFQGRRGRSIFYQALINANNGIQKLIVGGQTGNYPAKICVNLPQCLIAAITFYESGELEPLFTWEEDESLVTA